MESEELKGLPKEGVGAFVGAVVVLRFRGSLILRTVRVMDVEDTERQCGRRNESKMGDGEWERWEMESLEMESWEMERWERGRKRGNL